MKAEENARRRELAKEQRLNGEVAMDTLEDDEELAGDDDLLDDESDNEESMQVVCTFSSWTGTRTNKY